MKNERVRIRRRAFLAGGLATAALGPAVACKARGGANYWRFFTMDEARTVTAICAQIIPADADPGATEARVTNYIDIQLSARFRRHQRAYRQGIAAVDAASLQQFGKPLRELSRERQTHVLRDAEQNSSPFFELILTHTRQGVYGDPRHGGNYQMASWKMVGLPFPQVRGRQHYDEPKLG